MAFLVIFTIFILALIADAVLGIIYCRKLSRVDLGHVCVDYTISRTETGGLMSFKYNDMDISMPVDAEDFETLSHNEVYKTDIYVAGCRYSKDYLFSLTPVNWEKSKLKCIAWAFGIVPSIIIICLFRLMFAL